MPVGTPHVARCFLEFTYGTTGIRMGNVFHVRDTTDSIFADLGTFAGNVGAAAITALCPHLFVQNTIVAINAEDVRTVPFGGTTVALSGGGGTLSSSGASLPSSVCIAIKKSTGGLGRSARGRWFYPIGDASGLNNGEVATSAFVTGAVGALAAFQTAVEALVSGLEMGVVSYVNGGSPRSAGLFQRITAWTAVDNAVDSQRRRLLGRGS